MVMTTTKLNSPIIVFIHGRTKLIFQSRTTTITKPYSNKSCSSSSSSSSSNDNSDIHSPPLLPSPSDFPPWAYNPKPYFRFEILHQSTKSLARVGRIITPNGIVDTPGYVAVGTNATIKAVDFDIANSNYVNQQLVFANTYHLMIHPGTDIIRDAGGIHQFTGRGGGPFITDSGGFQIFSLKYGGVTESRESKGGELKRAAAIAVLSSKKNKKTNKSKSYWRSDVIGKVKVTEEYVEFRNYRNGNKVILSPESSIRAQKDIGADIIIPLDVLPPHHIDRNELAESVERSHRWEVRSLYEHLLDSRDRKQAIFCVIHGGTDVELRTHSLEYLTSLPWDGYAIGGSLGNGREDLKTLLNWMMPLFNTPERRDKCRHLLGIADVESIHNAVHNGCDTMDSSYPTKLARHGTLMTKDGLLRIKRGIHATSYGMKIDFDCECYACIHYDRAYLCHLFKLNDLLGLRLATIHNLYFMTNLMKNLRRKILDGII